jgi:conjugal transfer ATP-binding protein TraC
MLPQPSWTTELEQWHIRDGTIVTKQGNLEYGVEFDLPSLTLQDSSLLQELQTRWLRLLKTIPTGERLRLMVGSLPLTHEALDTYAKTDSDNAVVRHMREREAEHFRTLRRDGQLYQHRAFALLSHHPQQDTGFLNTLRNAFMRLVMGRRDYQGIPPETFEHLLSHKRLTQQRLEGALRAMNANPRPLDNNGLFELLQRYFNPDELFSTPATFSSQWLHFPKKYVTDMNRAPSTLRSRLTRTDVRRHFSFLELGDSCVGIVSADGFLIGETVTGMLSSFISQKVPSWLVLDVVHHNKKGLTRQMIYDASKMKASVDDRTITNNPDQGSVEGLESLNTAIRHFLRSGSEIYDLGVSVVLVAKTRGELLEAQEYLISNLNTLVGIEHAKENVALWKQFKRLSPGSGQNNRRLVTMDEQNVADLMPLNGPYKGHAEVVSILETSWDTLVGLNLFDPAAPNWNTMFVGMSGMGKTFTAQKILKDLYAKGADLIFVERGSSYAALTEALGGSKIAIDLTTSLNPFDLPDGDIEADVEKLGDITRVLQVMLESGGYAVEPLDLFILNETVSQTYAVKQRQIKTPHGYARVLDEVRMSDFLSKLRRMDQLGGRQMMLEEKAHAQHLASHLQGWTGNTYLGQFIDRPTNVDLSSRVMFFDTEGLDKAPQLAAVGFTILANLLWQRVQREPDRRKVILFDEMWSVLKYPTAAELVVDLARRARAYGVSLGICTNSLKEISADVMAGLKDNINFHFLFPLPKETHAVQQLTDLPDGALDHYRKLEYVKGVKSEFLFVARGKGGFVGEKLIYRSDPESYWLFTRDPLDLSLRRKKQTELGSLEAAIISLAKSHPHGTAQEAAK